MRLEFIDHSWGMQFIVSDMNNNYYVEIVGKASGIA